ncbi:MAG: phosphotransferase, partial [Bacteroidales bacterium]|nr:phosphotransferase [Bacteroidales bacterium]
MEAKIKDIFFTWKRIEATSIILLSASGSNRKYFRVRWTENINCVNEAGEERKANGANEGRRAGDSSERHCIAVFNEDIVENNAYLNYSKQLIDKNLPVPKILYIPDDKRIYFVEDLGDTTLFSIVESSHDIRTLTKIYKNAIDDLQRFQIDGGKNFDYTNAFPIATFGRQAMLWDLNYFKYMFLRLSNIPFSETALDNDFNTLIDIVEKQPSNYFLFRDFQSRNIMVQNATTLRYIDFQGGRQGALQYDLASLLYDAKANLPEEFRSEMLQYYVKKLAENYPQEFSKTSEKTFKETFYGFVLLRILQAMGTYGYRGLYEKKQLFIQSISYAVKNLQRLKIFPLPEINRLIDYLGGEVSPCGQASPAEKTTVETTHSDHFHPNVCAISNILQRGGSCPTPSAGDTPATPPSPRTAPPTPTHATPHHTTPQPTLASAPRAATTAYQPTPPAPASG